MGEQYISQEGFFSDLKRKIKEKFEDCGYSGYLDDTGMVGKYEKEADELLAKSKSLKLSTSDEKIESSIFANFIDNLNPTEEQIVKSVAEAHKGVSVLSGLSKVISDIESLKDWDDLRGEIVTIMNKHFTKEKPNSTVQKDAKDNKYETDRLQALHNLPFKFNVYVASLRWDEGISLLGSVVQEETKKDAPTLPALSVKAQQQILTYSKQGLKEIAKFAKVFERYSEQGFRKGSEIQKNDKYGNVYDEVYWIFDATYKKVAQLYARYFRLCNTLVKRSQTRLENGKVSNEMIAQERLIDTIVNNPLTRFSKRIISSLRLIGDERTHGKYRPFNVYNADARITLLRNLKTNIVKDADVGEVNVSKLYPAFIWDKEQIKDGRTLFRAIQDCDRMTKDIHIKMDKFIKDLAGPQYASKTTVDDDAVANLFYSTFGKELIDGITLKDGKHLEPLKMMDGCDDPNKAISALCRIMGSSIARAHHIVERFEDADNDFTKERKQAYVSMLKAFLGRLYTFAVNASIWVIRSVDAQHVSKEDFTAGDYISIESVFISLEAEDEEEKDNASTDDQADDTSEDEDATDDDTTDESSDEDSEDTDEAGDESDDTTSEETSETEDDSLGDDEEDEEDEDHDNQEPIEPPKEEEPRPELDEPNQDKIAIRDYLVPMLGDDVNALRLLSAEEVNRPLYHVSMNSNIKSFVPQVSKRTVNKENRSVPRISTSTSLIGCLNGYQSMVSDMDGRATKQFNGLFRVYELPYQYAVKPSKSILPDVDNSDEYWLISWKQDTYRTVPNVAADFTIPKIENVYGKDGVDRTFYMYVKVHQAGLYLDHERKLERGCYLVTLSGYRFSYPLKNNRLIKVEPVSENEYLKVTSLSMMIKTR